MNEHGSKDKVGWREEPSTYSDWRRTVGDGCYANDIDWLEWRKGPSGPRFVALIETTFYEDIPEWRHKLKTYCGVCLDRFKRDGQYSVAMAVSKALKVPAYFVVARYDLEVFFICRLKDGEWRQVDEPRYRAWIKWLGRAKIH